MDVFRYELRKTLILNGGMITACAFILLFFALNVYLDMPHNYSLEREKERYFEVTEQYVITGKLDEQMIASVYSIEKDYNNAANIFNNYYASFLQGELSTMDFSKKCKIINSKLMLKPVIDQLLNKIDYAKQEPEKRYIMYDNGWEALLNIKFPQLFICLAIFIVCIAFKGDTNDEMGSIITTCKYGRCNTLVMKLFAVTLVMLITYVVACSGYGLYIGKKYNLMNGTYPLQSLTSFSECNISLTIIEALVLISIFQIIGIISTICVSTLIITFIKNWSGALVMLQASLLLPTFINHTKVSTIYLTASLINSRTLLTGIGRDEMTFSFDQMDIMTGVVFAIGHILISLFFSFGAYSRRKII